MNRVPCQIAGVHNIGLNHDEPLVVSPARAKVMLDCGTTRLYELIAAGELEILSGRQIPQDHHVEYQGAGRPQAR